MVSSLFFFVAAGVGIWLFDILNNGLECIAEGSVDGLQEMIMVVKAITIMPATKVRKFMLGKRRTRPSVMKDRDIRDKLWIWNDFRSQTY